MGAKRSLVERRGQPRAGIRTIYRRIKTSVVSPREARLVTSAGTRKSCKVTQASSSSILDTASQLLAPVIEVLRKLENMPLPALQIQTLDGLENDVRLYVERRQRQEERVFLHGVFGHIRKMVKYSFFGDYPLLKSTLVGLKKLGVPVTAQKVKSCISRRCEDLRGHYEGKKAIVQALLADL